MQPVGCYWLSVRHYDPSLKRFLQPEPSEQEGTMSYVYAGGDPLDATDPSGLWCIAGLIGTDCHASQLHAVALQWEQVYVLDFNVP